MGIWERKERKSNNEMREKENREIFLIPMSLVMKTEEIIVDWVKRRPTVRVQAISCL